MPDFLYLLDTRPSAAQRSAIQHVRDAARDAGMNVFLAGGAVRDLISGSPVRDLDFSVQGGVAKLKKSLEKAGAVQWGGHAESHTLFYWFPGSVRVEISSTRREDYPKPGKPVYHHATMLEDLRRRDFTVNAMAISLNDGSYGLLLDPMNGIADIEDRHIRLVSNYGFIEDPSRMIRAVRLAARTGWAMDDRTKARYDNAKEEGLIQHLSPYLRGYELEEIGHEEDALKILRALEAEGWMEHLHAGWTSAKVDVAGLESLHQLYVKFLMQGVHPDLSAAQMRLLTAKVPARDLAELKKSLPCQGFVEQWEHLDEAAKTFSAKLTGKEATLPSDTWKLIANYQPEPALWLAYTSKSSAVQAKFHNFFEVWPEARQKIPTQLMAEMRITSNLPEYAYLLNEIFFALIDGKLETEEAMRAFLEPYSPPAPPPPVNIRRQRKTKAGARARLLQEEDEKKPRRRSADHDEDEDEDHDDDRDHDHDDEHDEDEDHDDHDDDSEEDAMDELPKPVKAAKPVVKAAEKKVEAKPAKVEPPAAKKAESAKSEAKKTEPKAKPVVAAKKAEKLAPVKAAPVKAVAAKAVKPAPAKAAPKKAEAAKPAAKKPAAKSEAKKPAAKPAVKAATKKPEVKKAAPAKAAAKVPAKKAPAKPAAKKAPAKKKR